MPVVGFEGQHPHIERARKSVEWLRGVFRNALGEELDLAEVTGNGEFPIVCIWQTYQPGGGDDGYAVAAFKVNPDGNPMSDEEFQREFSKDTYFLHFPSVCEIDTRQAEDGKAPSGSV